MTNYTRPSLILWLAFLLFLFPPFFANQKKEQTLPEAALPQTTFKMYRSTDGRLYVPGTLPVKLNFIAGGDQQEVSTPAWIFNKEGKQLLFAEGQTGGPVEIYVDLTPPRTAMQLYNAPEHEERGLSYYGKGVVFKVVPQDALSGVDATYFSMNGSSFVLLRGSLSEFEPNRENIIQVLSIDHVGNREALRTQSFFYDITPPISALNVTGPTFTGPVLAPTCTISLSATDAAAGLEGIYYRLDHQPEKKYSGPIPINKMTSGKHTLSWFAVDKVKNREQLQRFDFDHDDLAPAVSLLVEGPNHQQQNNIFIAPGSRLKLEAKDNRAGIATISYRLDAGKEYLYTEPIVLPQQSGLHKVEFIASDNVANQSLPISQYFYLDLTPPESEFKIEGFYTRVNKEFIIHKEIALYLAAADLEAGVHVILYKVNQGATLTYAKPITFDKDGLYQLEYWSQDNVGNMETPKTVTLRVDTSSAKTGYRKDLDSFPKQWYMHPDGRLIGSIDLPFFLYLGITDKNGKTIGEPILLDLTKFGRDDGKPVTFSKGGVNTLKITTGLPGKRGIEAFRVLIDSLPPQTSISFSQSASLAEKKLPCYGPAVQIRFSGVDDKQGIVSGYKETRVSVDDSDFFVYTKPLGIFSREKTYTIEYFSVDNVGNAEKVRRVQFTVDGTPPLTTPQVGGDNYGNILSSKSIIALNATDSLSGVKALYYAFDAGKEHPYHSPLTSGELTTLSEGKHTLRYYAVDRTQNREYPHEMTFLLDHGGPVVKLTLSGQQYPVNKTIYLATDSRIHLSATDSRTVVKNIHYRIGSNAPQVYSVPLTVPHPNQSISIGYTAEDNVGNITPWQYQMVVVDTHAPITQMKLQGPVFNDKFRLYAGPQTVIRFSAQDDHAGVRQILCSVDNGPFQTVTKPLRILHGGTHTLRFHAVDNVNNSENVSVKTITIDSTPPKLNVFYNRRSRQTPDHKKLLFPPDLMVSITASDTDTEVDKIIYRINDEKEKLYRNPLSRFEIHRDITLTVYAYDRLGNRAEKSITFRVEKGDQ